MKWISGIVTCLWASSAVAHPHIFIDSGVDLIFDSQGRLAAVRVTWAYDEFYSLMQLEELEMDGDGDGVLTASEQTELAGFDTNWVEGFEGDLYVTAAGVPVALAQPIDAGARLEDGQIVTWHTRALAKRVDPADAEVVLKIYDPTFYTAYSTDLGASIQGREGCEVSTLPADLGRAYDLVEELLNGEGFNDPDGDGFPPVGEHFADTLTLTCAPAS